MSSNEPTASVADITRARLKFIYNQRVKTLTEEAYANWNKIVQKLHKVLTTSEQDLTIFVAVLVAKTVALFARGFQFRLGKELYVMRVELVEIEVAPYPVDQANNKDG